MKPAFTFSEIREAEKSIIEKDGIPSLILMENAGKNAFDLIVSLLPDIEDYSVYIFCGKGNNAGDGFVIARNFLVNSIPVSVINLSSPGGLKGAAALNYDILRKTSSALLFCENANDENITELFDDLKKVKGKVLIIDALLGSGIKGEAAGLFRNAIELINSYRLKNKKTVVISIDVPSGLSSGINNGIMIYADHTITMGAVKKELLFGKAKECCGNIYAVPIGITDDLLDFYNKYNKYIVSLDDVKKLFPLRKKSSYKYSNGKVLVIGGSKGLSGAVIMSSLSALKSGSGAVMAGIPKNISAHFSRKLFEVIKTELDETDEGTISGGSYTVLEKQFKKADAVLIGPGLSLNAETANFLKDVIINCTKPLVIDADALTLLARDIEILHNRKSDSEIIITPHIGEFSKLCGAEISAVAADRFAYVREFSEKFNLNVMLKSETSISCTAKGSIYINNSGNEQLASAGSGDVLSGITVSLLAQSGNVKTAMLCGNFIHGMLAERYYEKSGNKQSASQQDLIKIIPQVITDLLN